MAYLLVLLALVIAGSYLLQQKLGLSSNDLDVMIVGIFGFGFLEALAGILVGVFAGATGTMLLASVLSLLLNGGLCYYFFKRSGL